MAGSFLLSWDQFDRSAGNAFRNLVDDKDLADVTLASEDGPDFRCHRVILASASPFFNKIIRKATKTEPYIYLGGVQSEALKHILQFLYLGETRVPNDIFTEFMNVANKLEVEGLKGEEINNEEDNLLSEPKHKDTLSESLQKQSAIVLEAKHEKSPQKHTEEIQNASESGKRFSCTNCEFSSNREERLNIHFEVQHQNQSKTFPCQDCEFEGQSQYFLKKHLSSSHVNKEEGSIENTVTNSLDSDKETNDFKSFYEPNVEEKYKEDKKLVECSICSHKSRKNDLMTHFESKHENSRYSCQKCFRVMTSFKLYKRHVRKIHGKSRFDCVLCDKETSDLTSLRLHNLEEHGLSRLTRRTEDSMVVAVPLIAARHPGAPPV